MSGKIKKIFWIILIAAIILVVGNTVYWEFFNADDGQKPAADKAKPTREERLADPNLLYASFWWSGLCSNKEGEEGGCYGEMYLYSSGKFIKDAGWTGFNNKKEIWPTVEKNFASSTIDNITETLRDSGVIGKECLPQEIMDAGWNYEVNLDGKKISFHNPPDECKNVFEKIDKIITPSGN